MTKGSESNSIYVAVATAGFLVFWLVRLGAALATEIYKYRNARNKEQEEREAKAMKKRKQKELAEEEEKKERKPDDPKILQLFNSVRFSRELGCCQGPEDGCRSLLFQDINPHFGDLQILPPRVMYSCLLFCDFQDVISAQRVCKSWRAFILVLTQDREYRRTVAKIGFPSKCHGKCWMVLSAAKLRRKGAYEYLVERGSVESLDEKTKHDISEMSIQRDIPRTLPNHMLFKDEVKQQHLFNVLKAYAVHDKVVGYVQGMNFMTAMLTTKYSEEDSFWMLDCIMNTYDARTVFVPELPRLAIALYQFEKLLALYLPDLAQHFDKIGVRPNMYGSEWFMTLFCYSFPLNTVERIWDMFFVDAWLVIHIVGLAILHRAQGDLLQLEFDKCVPYLKKYPDKSVFAPEGLLEMALSFGVTHEHLDELHQKFIDDKHYLNRYI